MSEAVPSPQDCCNPCDESLTTNIPGPPGTDGSDGSDGSAGSNAFTTLGAGFTMPAELATVQITVADTSWMVQAQGAVQGQIIYIQFAGHMEVVTVDSATLVTVRNLEDTANSLYPDNAPPTTAIPNASRVSPAGLQGPDGDTGVPLTTRGDLLTRDATSNIRLGIGTVGKVLQSDGTDPGWVQLTSADLSDIGTADTEIPPVDDAAGLTAGEALFATASGIESQAAATAQASLGLLSMATQAAGAVAITGGTINGTPIGGGTPAAGAFTTLTATGATGLSGQLAQAPSALQTLGAGGTINPNAGKVRVAGSGGAVTLTSTPSITAGSNDGQRLLIKGTSAVNTLTLQDESSLAGSTLELGAATRALGAFSQIELSWDATDSKWCEISFSAN